MIAGLKKLFYFPIASYFKFFATIRLKSWNPQIIVVTGSNGKTTLLHMLEAQIGEKARYSHHANSSFGIPFDILDLKRKTLLKIEWFELFLRAPFQALKPSPREKIYVVEADVDRPGEGKFLGSFLQPEIVLLASISKTHSMNFDRLVDQGKFEKVEDAIAYEFGYYLEYCKNLAIINGTSELAVTQKDRTKAKVEILERSLLKKYELKKDGTVFEMRDKNYSFPYLFPVEIFYTIDMCRIVANYLSISFDQKFTKLSPPPGRGSVFAGIKGITIIDSCYNANFASMSAILEMYKKFPSQKKWAVVGDMLEQGNSEKEEHEKLAELLATYQFEKLILMGPRVSKYTFPKLTNKKNIEKFLGPKEVLQYLQENIKGEETILFKGARFLEGVIENLLKDKKDAAKLARREKIWEIRRKKWGL